MSIRFTFGALALAVALAACDRSPPTAANEASAPSSPQYSVERSAMDRLARKLARALTDPAFRSYLKSQLDHSPFPEHKLQLQKLLLQSDRQALKEVAASEAAPKPSWLRTWKRPSRWRSTFPSRSTGTGGTGAPTCWSPAPGKIARHRWRTTVGGSGRC